VFFGNATILCGDLTLVLFARLATSECHFVYQATTLLTGCGLLLPRGSLTLGIIIILSMTSTEVHGYRSDSEIAEPLSSC
jgi:hypothetical protein